MQPIYPVVVIPFSDSYKVVLGNAELQDEPFQYDYCFGSFIIALCNIDFHHISSVINSIIFLFKKDERNTGESSRLCHFNTKDKGEQRTYTFEQKVLTIEEFVEKCYTYIVNKRIEAGELIIITLLLNEIYVQLKKTGNAYLTPDSDYVVQPILTNFTLFKTTILRFINNSLPEDEFNIIIKLQKEVGAKFFLDETGAVRVAYTLSEVFSLFALDLLNVQAKKISIKRCENCGLLFIPEKRSDEIYCDRIFKNGKTCKQIGYSMKEKNDPFKRLFTTARKTQHARIRYNDHIADYKEKHYVPWLAAAQKAKKDYEAINDIDGFRKWLEENKNNF